MESSVGLCVFVVVVVVAVQVGGRITDLGSVNNQREKLSFGQVTIKYLYFNPEGYILTPDTGQAGVSQLNKMRPDLKKRVPAIFLSFEISYHLIYTSFHNFPVIGFEKSNVCDSSIWQFFLTKVTKPLKLKKICFKQAQHFLLTAQGGLKPPTRTSLKCKMCFVLWTLI